MSAPIVVDGSAGGELAFTEAVAFEGLALIAIYLTLAGITLYETV